MKGEGSVELKMKRNRRDRSAVITILSGTVLFGGLLALLLSSIAAMTVHGIVKEEITTMMAIVSLFISAVIVTYVVLTMRKSNVIFTSAVTIGELVMLLIGINIVFFDGEFESFLRASLVTVAGGVVALSFILTQKRKTKIGRSVKVYK